MGCLSVDNGIQELGSSHWAESTLDKGINMDLENMDSGEVSRSERAGHLLWVNVAGMTDR